MTSADVVLRLALVLISVGALYGGVASVLRNNTGLSKGKQAVIRLAFICASILILFSMMIF